MEHAWRKKDSVMGLSETVVSTLMLLSSKLARRLSKEDMTAKMEGQSYSAFPSISEMNCKYWLQAVKFSQCIILLRLLAVVVVEQVVEQD